VERSRVTEEFEATPDLLGELRYERYLSRVDHYQRPTAPVSKPIDMTPDGMAATAEWLRGLHQEFDE